MDSSPEAPVLIVSLLSLLGYSGKGEIHKRSLGIKIPPTNLNPDFGDEAMPFANELAHSVVGQDKAHASS